MSINAVYLNRGERDRGSVTLCDNVTSGPACSHPCSTPLVLPPHCCQQHRGEPAMGGLPTHNSLEHSQFSNLLLPFSHFRTGTMTGTELINNFPISMVLLQKRYLEAGAGCPELKANIGPRHQQYQECEQGTKRLLTSLKPSKRLAWSLLSSRHRSQLSTQRSSPKPKNHSGQSVSRNKNCQAF